ncbi:MAG: hypothetical protein HY700_05350 [Gemmatimonadetes bacterium]|nr:hypothetical protein [Gemmatimonadota bacterium]
MYRTVEIVALAVLAAVFGLSALSRRYPQAAWLQVFRFEQRLSDEERKRIRRRSNIYAGIELILLGLVLPMGYAALTVMFFNEFTPTQTTIVAASSLLCIGLGVTAIWRNRRS